MEANPFKFLVTSRETYSHRGTVIDLHEIEHHFHMLCHFHDRLEESYDYSATDSFEEDVEGYIWHLSRYLRLLPSID